MAAGLWLVFMGLLALYLKADGPVRRDPRPLAGTIGVLLWSFLTSAALLLGLSFAAQLEAVRAGSREPRTETELLTR